MERREERIEVIARPAFAAVGMRWEGTFAEAGAGGIRAVQRNLASRLAEIEGRTDDGILLGLSYHASPDASSFVHYAAVRVDGRGATPDGMARVDVPALTYAATAHRKGQSIDATYRNLYRWIEQQGLSVLEGSLTHCEEYPLAQDPDDPDPEFAIWIPVAGR